MMEAAEWKAMITKITPETAYRVDLAGFLRRTERAWPAGAEDLASAMIALGLAAAAIHRLRHHHDGASHRLSSDIICMAVLLCMYHLGYDLVLLTAPAVALAWSSVPVWFTTARFRRTMLMVIAGLGVNYLTTQAVLDHLRSHRLWLLVASFNTILLLVLFIAYVARTVLGTTRFSSRILPPTLPEGGDLRAVSGNGPD
jgi:hypothetical protein